MRAPVGGDRGPAEHLIDATDTVRAAWLNAQIASTAVDTAVAVLAAAARLCGTAAATHEEMLPLICCTARVHRRVLWTAYESESRCGRWPALATVTEIRAAADLPVEPYRRPQPMQEQWTKVARGQAVRSVVDPEDIELATQNG